MQHQTAHVHSSQKTKGKQNYVMVLSFSEGKQHFVFLLKQFLNKDYTFFLDEN
jgi:hypothetical protein